MLGNSLSAAFRADASYEIGTGHVMRCLTLASALAQKGASCHFICREHLGNLIDLIVDRGFYVHTLPESNESKITTACSSEFGQLAHSHWLGTTQHEDAQACAMILKQLQPDWLIVDHYALDSVWETTLEDSYSRLLVIDDLVDRAHQCDLLLDQTFGRNDSEYAQLVPSHCKLLCGSQYALLRPEFAELRSYSLQRRTKPALRRLLISLGGVDKDNMTTRVLEALRVISLPRNCQISVIMGATAPWLTDVQRIAQDMPWPTDVLVNVDNMGQLMADSDLAVGAAGATSWERCCLGLPTIMVALAENQRATSIMMEEEGIALRVVENETMGFQLQRAIDQIEADFNHSRSYILRPASVVDGLGANRVIEYF